MVEEEHVEKFTKKEKLKNGQASLPKNKNCTVDDGSPAEVKKEKKKSKKVDVVAIDVEECSWSGGGEKEEKKKKKKRTVTESVDDGNSSDVKNENNEAKKKKKKKLADDENHVETEQSSLKEEVENRQGKEKREKCKSVHIKSENIRLGKGKEGEQQAAQDKTPKKAKKGKNNALVISTEEAEEQVKERKKKRKKTTDDETTDAIDAISVTKNKIKDTTKGAENQVKLETAEGEMGEVVQVKKEKRNTKEKRKEKREEVGGEDVGTPQMKECMFKKKKDKSTESEIHSVEEGQTEVKKKGKKQKGRKASVEVSEVDETEPKKKRKKHNSKGEKEGPLSLKCEKAEVQERESDDIVAGDTTSKKRKKMSMNIETQEENVSLESGIEKKKKKKKKTKEEVEDQHESPQVDVVFLSGKISAGNTDEVNMSQERRQALQKETDHATQPPKPARLKGFGQWSTAEFNSSEQQQKFLRLMGGFKKGFQAAAGNTEKANMALGKDAQQNLQQGLLGEFERAQSRRLDFSNRGAGLGFTAPSNKKFAIDINACRSVRFDD